MEYNLQQLTKNCDLNKSVLFLILITLLNDGMWFYVDVVQGFTAWSSVLTLFKPKSISPSRHWRPCKTSWFQIKIPVQRGSFEHPLLILFMATFKETIATNITIDYTYIQKASQRTNKIMYSSNILNCTEHTL